MALLKDMMWLYDQYKSYTTRCVSTIVSKSATFKLMQILIKTVMHNSDV